MITRITLSAVILLGLSFSLISPIIRAEACSYREALIAYEQGNKVRGDALMRMAANDGDMAAVEYLQSITRPLLPTLASNYRIDQDE